MYAYKNTKSMIKAVEETKRRRAIQEKFNQDNNITPKTIDKSVGGGVLETLRGKKSSRSNKLKNKKPVDVSLNKEEIELKIKELKKEMKNLAKDLDFESAAKVRDEIKVLSEARLLL